MEMIMTLLMQVLTMFILVGIGYIMFVTKKISLEGSKTLGNILIFLSLPCVIINGFLIERTSEHLWGFLYSTIAAAVTLALATVISRMVFRNDAIAAFAGSFSNPGFFGVPLIVASLSNGAVFYIASFIAFLNLLQWTYGVAIMTQEGSKEKKSLGDLISFKKIITAPFMIAIIIGLIFFLGAIPMPGTIAKCISFLAGLNTPLAMFTVGVYLAQTNIAKMIVKPKLYLISFVRLILIPAAAILVLWVVPASFMELKLAILISIACPVGSNIAVYAQLHDKDYPYAVETVVISTLLSVITIPAVVWVATCLW